jgi:hypothetical protein
LRTVFPDATLLLCIFHRAQVCELSRLMKYIAMYYDIYEYLTMNILVC